MPVYTYRRADGSTFDIRQKFKDSPLVSCPTTGQAVNRVIQPAGIIFKGSGFYVNDNNKASKPASPTATSDNGATSSDEKKEAPAKDKPAPAAPAKAEGAVAAE